MTFKEWITTQPSKFPDLIGHHSENTPYQNPIIGDDQKQTYDNVKQVIDFFIQMALSSYTEPVDFSMNESATWGFINILECLSGAMTFEDKHRPDGGIPYEDEDKGVDNKNQKNTEQNISLKPHHGVPLKKYWIFRMNPDGTAKHLGSVMAPNEELAQAKAKKNLASEAKEGCSIFVKEDQFDDPDGSS
jgi:hypothetical protein